MSSTLTFGDEGSVHYVTYCNVLDSKFELLKKFPGKFCHFFEDGTFVSASETELSLYDQKGQVIWKKPFHAHHQINVNKKGEILLLSSELRLINKVLTRFDKLVIIDKAGSVLKEWSFFDHQRSLLLAMKLKKSKTFGADWAKLALPGVVKETSHANSFYEIQSNKSGRIHPAFKEGNYIINSKFGAIFILDHNLKTLLWSLRWPKDGETILHDVQVLNNGNLLIYNNLYAPRTSTLEEINPFTTKVAWNYGLKKNEGFFSGYTGGVQILSDDTVLFTDIGIGDAEVFKEAHIKIINREGKILADKVLTIFGKNELPIQVKRVNLKSFLLNNKITN